MIQNAGTQLITADAAVGGIGKAVRVFMLHMVSDGTAGVVILRNGTTASATAWVTETGTISTGKTISFGTQGILFPAGCFVDLDTHAVSNIVTYTYE